MRKFFARCGRIWKRVYGPVKTIKGAAVKILAILLSIGVVEATWAATAGEHWLKADWTHRGFVYAALFIIASLCALYRDEVEREKAVESTGFKTIFQGDIGYGRENAMPGSRQGDHGLYAELEVKEDKADPQEVRIYTSAPIVHVRPRYPEIKSVRQECIIFYPGNRPLKKGMVFKFHFYSHSPIRLVRVHMTTLDSPEPA